MSFDAAILTLFVLLGINVIGLVAYALTVKLRARRELREIVAIRAAILDYFTHNGVGVAVRCARLPGDVGFTAIVESEPMKRFRLSHIIEMTLCEHVRKTCGLKLDKVYWRFPVRQVTEAAAVAAVKAENVVPPAVANEKKVEASSDDYINEGLEHYRYIPKPDVEELPWEHFEQVTTGGLSKTDDDTQ